MALDDVNSVLLNRVLVRLYEDVASINTSIAQVQADVRYLVQSGQLTDEDARFILSKVPLTTDPSASVMHAQAMLQGLPLSDSPPPNGNAYTSNLNVPTSVATPTQQQQQHPRGPIPKIPVAHTFFQARVLWDYNLDNEHPEDLTLYTGDIVDVEEASTEQNADWWMGRIRGRSGLFPSAYVERITQALPPAPPAPAIVKSSRPSSEVSAPTYSPYRATHLAMNANTSAMGGGRNSLGLQPSEENEVRRAKYDHLKSSMTHPAAARGASFGAGAALASSRVRAIF